MATYKLYEQSRKDDGEGTECAQGGRNAPMGLPDISLQIKW